MKKVVCFGLCFLIVLCSFVISFADSSWVQGGSPVILVQGDDPQLVLTLEDSAYTYSYSSNIYPVYFVVLYDGSNYKSLFFSDSSGTIVHYIRTSPTSPDATGNLTLSSQYNGYYYLTSSLPSPPVSTVPVLSASSAQDAIDFVNSTVFSVTFDLSYLTNGAVSWLSTMAQAVKNSGLLLFMVLIGFVGIGIGLFRRFTNG